MTKKPSLIEILGAIICGNSIFSLISLVFSVLSVQSLVLTFFGSNNPKTWIIFLSNSMSQITSWTVLLGAILWLVWLFLCFGKYNQTELKKVNQIGTVLHYVLGGFFFGIPLLYLPFHHYKLLFGKINKTSKLPLIWQILNILSISLVIPFIILIFSIIFVPFLALFIAPVAFSIITTNSTLATILGIFILLIYLVQTLLSCYFIWQISEKL